MTNEGMMWVKQIREHIGRKAEEIGWPRLRVPEKLLFVHWLDQRHKILSFVYTKQLICTQMINFFILLTLRLFSRLFLENFVGGCAGKISLAVLLEYPSKTSLESFGQFSLGLWLLPKYLLIGLQFLDHLFLEQNSVEQFELGMHHLDCSCFGFIVPMRIEHFPNEGKVRIAELLVIVEFILAALLR